MAALLGEIEWYVGWRRVRFGIAAYAPSLPAHVADHQRDHGDEVELPEQGLQRHQAARERRHRWDIPKPIVDIFRDGSLGGGAKALWLIGLLVFPSSPWCCTSSLDSGAITQAEYETLKAKLLG